MTDVPPDFQIADPSACTKVVNSHPNGRNVAVVVMLLREREREYRVEWHGNTRRRTMRRRRRRKQVRPPSCPRQLNAVYATQSFSVHLPSKGVDHHVGVVVVKQKDLQSQVIIWCERSKGACRLSTKYDEDTLQRWLAVLFALLWVGKNGSSVVCGNEQLHEQSKSLQITSLQNIT